MSININVPSAKADTEQLPAIVNRVGNVKSTISALRSSIDARVLDRNNLRARLRSIQGNLESMEDDLSFLHRTISQNIVSYEENESRINKKVQSVPTKVD